MRSRGKLVLSRLSLHEQVVDRLREMIVSGELVANEKVPVSELAESLDVSLTPLREALKVLAGEHLIELTPNRGARVRPITVDETRDLFEVMSGIEALAAELSAERITEDELGRLETMHAEMLECFRSDDKERYFQINREIHNLIVEYARNPILSQMRKNLAVRAERVRYLAVREGNKRDEAVQDHEDLMAALRAHDRDNARRVWRRHLLRSGQEICAILAAEEAEQEQVAGMGAAAGSGRR
jgi:DNA-binding GntR family transcriptional regulator